MNPKDKDTKPARERQEISLPTNDVVKILEETSKSPEPLPTPRSLLFLGQRIGRNIGQNARQTSGLTQQGPPGAGRVVSQAGRLAAQAGARIAVGLFSTPAGWVIIAVGAVVVVTFVIVFSVGGGVQSPEQNTIVTPAAP